VAMGSSARHGKRWRIDLEVVLKDERYIVDA
jgi:hypothetical protein